MAPFPLLACQLVSCILPICLPLSFPAAISPSGCCARQDLFDTFQCTCIAVATLLLCRGVQHGMRAMSLAGSSGDAHAAATPAAGPVAAQLPVRRVSRPPLASKTPVAATPAKPATACFPKGRAQQTTPRCGGLPANGSCGAGVLLPEYLVCAAAGLPANPAQCP